MITPTFVHDVTLAVAGSDKVEAMEMTEKMIRDGEK